LNHVQRESWRDGDFGGTFGPRTPVRHVARTPVPNPRVRSVDVEELEGDRRRCLAMLRRLAGLWEERSGVTWRSSAAIKGQSMAIKGQLRGNQGAIKGNQWAIKGQSRGVGLGGSPWQSRAIKGQSSAIKGQSRELKRQSRDSRLSVALDHCGTHYQGHTTKGTQ
jgi:hypothetical protein